MSAVLSVRVAISDPALAARATRILEESGIRVGDDEAAQVEVVSADAIGARPYRNGNGNGLNKLPTGQPPVVVVTAENPRRSRRSLPRGAHGFVMQDAIVQTLAPTISAVAAGQVCLPREERYDIDPQPLSSRERQTLSMVVIGFSNAEIARRLYLAESTVKSHLSSAFKKLGVRSRSEAAALVLDPKAGLGVGILAIPESDRRRPVAAAAKST